MLCGGKSEEHEANEEVQSLLHGLKAEIEGKLGSAVSELRALKFSTQVVAGTNYFIKAAVGDGKFIHVRAHRGLPHTGGAVSLHSVQADKGEHDAIDFF